MPNGSDPRMSAPRPGTDLLLHDIVSMLCHDPCEAINFFFIQERVFEDLGNGVLDNAWEGYNCSLFAYGQTGSGKSYSMVGYGVNKGIIPVTCEQLFKGIQQHKNQETEFQVILSMLEIYNEQVQ